MLGDLFSKLGEFAGALWPLRIVQQWEVGCYYVLGRYRGTVPAGCYPVFPWFMDLLTVPTQPAIIGTPRGDITLADGRTLSFIATAKVRVINADKALNLVDQYQESTREILMSVLAEKLADIEPDRLEPARRGRLLTALNGWVAAEAAEYGIEVSAVRFTTFVIQPKVFRVLGDDAVVAQW